MPRLLLVDDNPSIHKIAETLLASSDIQLVSCCSGDQAMALVGQGDRFDVALLDTSMLGMDGWALLKLLRETESTAKMPVAMMAGVLDIVDPEKLRLAPIQGFLKKPVELRDLGDRIQRLLDTPVLPPPVPAAPVEPSPFVTQPGLRLPDRLVQPAPDADILLLGPEDLLDDPSMDAPTPRIALAEDLEVPAEDATALAPQDPDSAGDEEPLDLEELDLEGLRDLSLPPSAFLPPVDPEPFNGAAPAEPGEGYDPEPLAPDTVPDFTLEDALGEPEPAVAEDLPAAGASLPDSDIPLDWSDDSDSLVLPPPPAPAESMDSFGQESFTAEDLLDTAAPLPDPPEAVPEPEAWPLASEDLGAPDITLRSELLQEPPAQPVIEPPQATPAVSVEPEVAPAAGAPADPIAALLSDPVLMDRLAKAMVERMGDQILREIAWEVMPELAERLHQQALP